jgi:chromosome partitioning protein
MKVITIAAPKGGSGKTTIASALAARAAQESGDVLMIDLNSDQGDLTRWWQSRGEPDNPFLFENITHVRRDLADLATQGWEWCFIDTPPVDLDLIQMSVIVADAVIVPVRASYFDIGSVDPIVEMCAQHKKPYAFVMSAVDARFKGINDSARTALVETGTLLSAHTSYRASYINAVTAGKSGPEIDANLKAEIDILWAEAKRLSSQTPWQTWGAANVR